MSRLIVGRVESVDRAGQVAVVDQSLTAKREQASRIVDVRVRAHAQREVAGEGVLDEGDRVGVRVVPGAGVDAEVETGAPILGEREADAAGSPGADGTEEPSRRWPLRGRLRLAFGGRWRVGGGHVCRRGLRAGNPSGEQQEERPNCPTTQKHEHPEKWP